MIYTFIGKKPEDAKSGHMYDFFTAGKQYSITTGLQNKKNPKFKEVYRAEENYLTIDDVGQVIWVSGNAFRKYFIKYVG